MHAKPSLLTNCDYNTSLCYSPPPLSLFLSFIHHCLWSCAPLPVYQQWCVTHKAESCRVGSVPSAWELVDQTPKGLQASVFRLLITPLLDPNAISWQNSVLYTDSSWDLSTVAWHVFNLSKVSDVIPFRHSGLFYVQNVDVVCKAWKQSWSALTQGPTVCMLGEALVCMEWKQLLLFKKNGN